MCASTVRVTRASVSVAQLAPASELLAACSTTVAMLLSAAHAELRRVSLSTLYVGLVMLMLCASLSASSLAVRETLFGEQQTAASATIVARLAKSAASAEERRTAVLGAFAEIHANPDAKLLVLKSAPRLGTPYDVLGGVLLEFVAGAVLSLMTDRRFLVAAGSTGSGLPALNELVEGATEWIISTPLPECDAELNVDSLDAMQQLGHADLQTTYPGRVLCIVSSHGAPFSEFLRHNPNYARDLHLLFEHRLFQIVARELLRPTGAVQAHTNKILVAHKGIFVGVHFPDDAPRTPAAVLPREKDTLLACVQEVAKDEKDSTAAALKVFVTGASAASFQLAASRLGQSAFLERGAADGSSPTAVYAEALALTHAEDLVLLESSRFSQLIGTLTDKAVFNAILSRCALVNCPLPVVVPVHHGCAGPSPLVAPRKKVGMLVMATGKYLSFVLRQVHSANTNFLPNSDVTYYVFSDLAHLPEPGQERDNIVLIKHEGLRWPEATLLRFHVYLEHWDEFGGNDYLFALDADMEWVSIVNNEDLFGEVVAALHPGYYLESHSKISGTYENNPRSSAYVPDHDRTSYFAGGFYGGQAARVKDLLKGCKELVESDRKWGYIAVWHDESYLNRYFKSHPPTRILTPEFVYPEPPVDQHFYTLHHPVQIKPKLYALNKNHAEMRN